MSQKLKINDVNQFESKEFINLFKNVVELWPKAAESVIENRPFTSLNELIQRFHDYLENISVDDKIAILQSHPDLAGKLADENKLSSESTQEQASAGLNKLSNEQKSELIQSNTKYFEKFQFPFVICVRESNKIERILEGFRNRIPNDRDQEIINGIDEVKKICSIRIQNIVDF